MIKCFSTVLFFSSILTVSLCACANKKTNLKTKDAERFEQLLKVAQLQTGDSVRYLIWNSTSCSGCRSKTVKLLQNGKGHHIKLIAPFRFAGATNALSATDFFVDTTGIFDSIYFGIDNIGIVNVYNNEVINIKNYNPEAMDSLTNDLLK